ncbi:class I SAM-dependent methyltransferase [Bremerella cremea]|uniref:Class I SAM-dependent methyltransferase n=1 Tax=Bremerella cremea TaxID=1031537 RepID=A0A368KM06_9BACT|nr:class I SAM-dependent methyltransferase [Bremerella cremea]RCS42209.1 class I SAM-dependent methyltransferase [Bremerella cremea]
MRCQHTLEPEPPPRLSQYDKMESSEQSAPLNLAHWLTSREAAEWFAWLSKVDPQAIATLSKLRQELTAEQSQAILNQAQLRQRGVKKFTRAGQMFFTRVGQEQATDEEIAAYKACRFSPGQPLADLCCGIGGDLIALAQRGPTMAVDASPEHLCYAEANVAAYDANLAGTQCGLAEETPLQEFAAWHIDPDRRSDNRRTIKLDHFSPALPQLEMMLRANRNAALKLAPASRLPPEWEEQGECEWITHHRECKQLVVWLGNLAPQPGLRRATRIGNAGQIDSFLGSPNHSYASTEIAACLFDPDPALVASGLVDTLAAELNLARVSPQSHYLTGPLSIEHPLLSRFEVQGVEKIDTKRLKKAITAANWGTLELKQRGLELKLEALRKQLKPRGDGPGTIIFTPTTVGNRAILCQRFE